MVWACRRGRVAVLRVLRRVVWACRRGRVAVLRVLRRVVWECRRGRVAVLRVLRRVVWECRRGRVAVLRVLRRGRVALTAQYQGNETPPKYCGNDQASIEFSTESLTQKSDPRIERPKELLPHITINYEENSSHHAEKLSSWRNALAEFNLLSEAFGFGGLPSNRVLRRYQRQLRALVRSSGTNFGRRYFRGSVSWKNRKDLRHLWRADLPTCRTVGSVESLNHGADEFFLCISGAVLGVQELGVPITEEAGGREASVFSSPWTDLLRTISIDFRFEVSVVLATRRPEQIEFALSQLSTQKNCDIELVLVCHGFELGSRRNNLLNSVAQSRAITGLKILEFIEEQSFGAVLTAGTHACSKEFVAKWDDDDFYGSRHLLGLYTTLVTFGADIVGRPANFVEELGDSLVFHRVAGQEFSETKSVAGGTIFGLKSALLGAGGWGEVSKGVDQFLLGKAVRKGFLVYSADAMSFILSRRSEGHTWIVPDDYFVRASDYCISTNFRGLVLEPGQRSTTQVRSTADSSRTVSVCIPFKDNAISLGRQIERYSSESGLEIIAVDDRSRPPLNFPSNLNHLTGFRIDHGDGFGAGAARNLASKESNGEILIFHDSDILLDDEVVEFTKKAMQNVDVVHGEIAFVYDVGQRSISEFFSCAEVYWEQSWRENHWRRSFDLSEFTTSSYRATVGGFLAVKREIHDAIGGFRDVRIRGVEDTEYGFRLSQYGVSQALYRGTGIRHLGSRTFANRTGKRDLKNREFLMRSYIPNFTRDGIFSRQAEKKEKHFLYFPSSIQDEVTLSDIPLEKLSAVSSFENMFDIPLAFFEVFDTFNISERDLTRLGAIFYGPGSGAVILFAGRRKVGVLIAFGKLNNYLRQQGVTAITSSETFEARRTEVRKAVSKMLNESKLEVVSLNDG